MEQIEDVLTQIGFNTFDTTDINTLATQAISDSSATLAFLDGYSLVFSDCHCGDEGGAYFANLSRVYGRYVQRGGKMYGGHYNYFHLQRIWKGSYDDSDNQEVAAHTVALLDQDIVAGDHDIKVVPEGHPDQVQVKTVTIEAGVTKVATFAFNF